MTIKKQNRSFILQSVISKNGSWNSDFNGSPKRYDNQFFASDRALKYAVRSLIEQMGKEVLIKKWIKFTPTNKSSNKKSSDFDVMTSKELKAHIKEEKGRELSAAFWDFEDVRQFGMLYDGLGIHGVVQISQGLDLYGQGAVYNDDLTGRMVFESSSQADKNTRGMSSREFLSEAHFVYDISVNPSNVHHISDVPGYEHCIYSEGDYQLLLECLQNGPMNIKSSQKLNAYTGFMLRIELLDDQKTLLSDLQGKLIIKPDKVDGKAIYDLRGLFQYLKNRQELVGKPLYKGIYISYEEADIQLSGVNDSFVSVAIEKY